MKKEPEEIEFEIQMGKIKSEKQKRVLEFLKENEGATIQEVEMFTDCSKSILKTLEKNNYIEFEVKKVDKLCSILYCRIVPSTSSLAHGLLFSAPISSINNTSQFIISSNISS